MIGYRITNADYTDFYPNGDGYTLEPGNVYTGDFGVITGVYFQESTPDDTDPNAGWYYPCAEAAFARSLTPIQNARVVIINFDESAILRSRAVADSVMNDLELHDSTHYQTTAHAIDEGSVDDEFTADEIYTLSVPWPRASRGVVPVLEAHGLA